MGGSLPLRSSRLTRARRRVSASGVLTAACTTAMSSRGKTNSVRRIAIHRTRLRRAYTASATSLSVETALRASTDRYTDAGSVACKATTACVAASGSLASPAKW